MLSLTVLSLYGAGILLRRLKNRVAAWCADRSERKEVQESLILYDLWMEEEYGLCAG